MVTSPADRRYARPTMWFVAILWVWWSERAFLRANSVRGWNNSGDPDRFGFNLVLDKIPGWLGSRARVLDLVSIVVGWSARDAAVSAPIMEELATWPACPCCTP